MTARQRVESALLDEGISVTRAAVLSRRVESILRDLGSASRLTQWAAILWSLSAVGGWRRPASSVCTKVLHAWEGT